MIDYRNRLILLLANGRAKLSNRDAQTFNDNELLFSPSLSLTHPLSNIYIYTLVRFLFFFVFFSRARACFPSIFFSFLLFNQNHRFRKKKDVSKALSIFLFFHGGHDHVYEFTGFTSDSENGCPVLTFLL